MHRDETYLGGSRHNTKRAECVIEKPLVHVLVQVADEQVCSNVQLFFIRRCLAPQKKTSQSQAKEQKAALESAEPC